MIAFGDSHIKMFESFTTSICKVPGATLYGLSNFNSQTSSRMRFFTFLKQPSTTVISLLGEVDCNALYWRKSSTMTFQEYSKIAIKNYFNFLNLFNHQFIISSIPLPTVKSYQQSPYTLRNKSPRFHVKALRNERKTLVLSLNQEFKKLAEENNYHYLDITTPTINKKGELKTKFISDPADSHLNIEAIKPIIERKLNELKLGT